jgi:hypothetical protein
LKRNAGEGFDMAVLKEFRCAIHGEFESVSKKCSDCGNDLFVTQEIRTAPAFKGRSTKFIDGQLREIADDYGLTDMRNDVKGGVSVAQARLNRLSKVERPRWGEVPHAQPGFSRDPNAEVPKVTAESMGFVETPASKMNFPPPPTQIVGRYNG